MLALVICSAPAANPIVPDRVLNDPRMDRYTEHMNLLGILTDAIPSAQQRAVMEKILAGAPEMAKATIYFGFCYGRALVKTGLADRYLDTFEWGGRTIGLKPGEQSIQVNQPN